MKILGISAGTHNGNNDAICREALMGAKEMGAEVEFVNLLNLNLKNCTGCIACVISLMTAKGGKCVLKDDFEWIQKKMLAADGIIFAVPVFEKGAAAVFRTMTDRFGPRHDKGMNIIAAKIAEETKGIAPDPDILKDKVVSFIGVGGSDWTTRIRCDFGNFADICMWKTIEIEVFSWSKCIIMEDEKIARAHEMGQNLAKAATDIENAKYLGDTGVCPCCHNRNLYIQDDPTKAICCQCGVIGELKVVNGKMVFDVPQEMYPHAHNTLSGKFMHMDDIRENEGKLMEFMKTDEFKERKKKYQDFITATKPN